MKVKVSYWIYTPDGYDNREVSVDVDNTNNTELILLKAKKKIPRGKNFIIH
tara:strand:+ start:11118 stop:11270 length:153 start_codon:yes stop_codon:yes gene_type:complete